MESSDPKRSAVPSKYERKPLNRDENYLNEDFITEMKRQTDPTSRPSFVLLQYHYYRGIVTFFNWYPIGRSFLFDRHKSPQSTYSSRIT